MKELLDVVLTVFGITGWSLSIIFVALWEKVFRHRYYRWKYRKTKTGSDYILIVGNKDNINNAKAKISTQSESSLPKLKGLPIEPIELPEICTAATSKELIDKLNGLRSNMAKVQKFNMHLFYAGPVVLSAYIGGFFYNKDNVYVYQQNAAKEYEYWGSINGRK